MNANNKEKKIKILTLAYALAVVVLGLLALFAIAIYGFGADNQLTKKAARIFPYPAAVMDGVHIISLNNLEENVVAVKRFYENQDFGSVGLKVDFATADGRKRLKIKERDLLTKMIENRIVEMLANKQGIVLTKQAVDQEVNKRIAEFGSGTDLTDNLQRLYGWSLEDFKERIVQPDMYKTMLAEKVRQNGTSGAQAKTKIDQAALDLKAKKDFSEVAKKYSEGESAGSGGELGWFSADQMLPEIATVAFNMKKGGTSDVIESSLGYHIIQVEDIKIEDEVNKLKLRQIFVRTQNFSDWLLEQEKNIKIWIPLKDFKWNKEAGVVEFTNNDLQQFESELDKNSPDEASMIF
ncbi:MAG: peptidylprolyl isomerase [Parcubacteria group bacterium]|jgi:parvulin-like peptidyl-prolyl isomerase